MIATESMNTLEKIRDTLGYIEMRVRMFVYGDLADHIPTVKKLLNRSFVKWMKKKFKEIDGR